MKRHNSKTPEQHQKFARLYSRGASLRMSMIKSGYSEKQANKGMAALSRPMIEALAGECGELEQLGRSVTSDKQEHIARGRLLMNAIRGKDDGVQSAKLLWQDKAVNQLTPENQIGVAVYQVSPRLEQLAAQLASEELPVLDATPESDPPVTE